MKRYYKVERFGLGHNHVDWSHRAIHYKTWRTANHAAIKANKYSTKHGWNFTFCAVEYLSER